MEFRQVGQLRRPVVHLRVDVGRVVAAPGGLEAGIPDALQVGGLATRLRAADQQVASELEIGRHERCILGPLEGQQAVIDRPVLVVRPTQVQFHPVELLLVGSDVGGKRPVVSLRGILQVSSVARVRIARHVLVVDEIRSQGDMQQQLRRALHAQGLASGAHPAAPGRHPGVIDIADRALDAALVVGLALQAQEIAARGADPGILHRRLVEKLTAEGLGPGSRQAHDDELVGEGGKNLFHILHATDLVAGAHDRPVDVEFATVVAHLPLPAGEADLQRTGSLVVHLFTHGGQEAFVAEILGFFVPAGEDQVPHLLQMLECLGVPVLVRAACGDGLLVELEFLHVGTAVDHRADAAVADRPRLLPGNGRLVEPKDILGRLGGQAGGRRPKGRQQDKHSSHMFNSL